MITCDRYLIKPAETLVHCYFCHQVALPGIGCVAFTALLAYLYTDLCPDLSTVDALDMLELANCYCLPRLVALTEEHIISELQQKDASGADVTEDVLLLLEHAQVFNCHSIR